MPDPHLVYGRRYSSGGIHNATGYSNHRFDKIIVAASQIIDMRRRIALYQEAEGIRAADLPTLYLVFPDRIAWTAPEVTGLCLRPSWAIDLGAVRIANRNS
jgi:ABC-type transport system substrate-binding protein